MGLPGALIISSRNYRNSLVILTTKFTLGTKNDKIRTITGITKAIYQ